jgi:HSP20 family protein
VRICGQRDEIPRQGDTSYRLAEIQYGQFERILVLPAPIDPEKVSATYTNGFLEIRMSKLQAPKTLRIPISEG